jgi:hypothetical protein
MSWQQSSNEEVSEMGGKAFDDLDGMLDDDGEVAEENLQEEEGPDEEEQTPPDEDGEETDVAVADESVTNSEPELTDNRQPQPLNTTISPSPTTIKKLSSREHPGKMGRGDRYPFAMRRESWNDERSGKLNFVIREGTAEMEEIAVDELKNELYPNSSLNVTDLREAAYIVGLQNFDDVVDILNEWGFAEQEDLRK